MAIKSRYYVINVVLKEMINEGIIGLTLPNIPKSAKQRYYVL